MDYQPLKYIFKGTGKPDATTLLVLHGTGGDENQFLSLAQDFGHDINILSVRGNVIENGMPRFFKRRAIGVFDEMDLEFRVNELVDFLKALAATENFDVNKIVALGYSNGANIAGALLILYPDFLSGAILFRPMRPFGCIPDFKIENPKPLFLSFGRNDTTINREDANTYIKLLKNSGFDVTNHEINTGHNLLKEDVVLSIEWFKKNFRK